MASSLAAGPNSIHRHRNRSRRSHKDNRSHRGSHTLQQRLIRDLDQCQVPRRGNHHHGIRRRESLRPRHEIHHRLRGLRLHELMLLSAKPSDHRLSEHVRLLEWMPTLNDHWFRPRFRLPPPRTLLPIAGPDRRLRHSHSARFRTI